MQKDKKIVVYEFNYNEQSSWAYISNFVSNFYKKKAISLSEADEVSTYVFSGGLDNQSLINEIRKAEGKFRKILHPENLYDVEERYENVFFIKIAGEKLNDVVELQKLYLIFKNFAEFRILVFVECASQLYFSISRFMKWVNDKNDTFYNSVYFHISGETQNSLKRMTRKGERAFRTLLPLLEIDNETDNILRSKVSDILELSEIEKIFSNDKIKVSGLDFERSALVKLQDFKMKFDRCMKKELMDVIGKMELLTLIIFASYLEKRTSSFKDIKEIKRCVEIIEKYVQGYLQLTENILFHTEEKVGIFCFRLLAGNAEYVKNKYSLTPEAENLAYFEISISDYSGNEENGNIAENFLNKMKNEGRKELFEGMQPVHFFQNVNEMEESMQNAWKEYYDDVDNIARHYGLKIFKTLIDNAGGKFVMESHSSHVPHVGECVGMKYNETICLPGTAYSILMPINMDGQYSDEEENDFGIANEICYEDDIALIAQKKVNYIEKIAGSMDYGGEIQKNDIVNQIAKALHGQNANSEEIIAVNAYDLEEKDAELVYKAIVKAAKQEKLGKFIAFYNCEVKFVYKLWHVAYGVFQMTEYQYILRNCDVQIALYTQDSYEEMILVLNDYNWTVALNNQLNFTRETRWKKMFLALKAGWNIWSQDKKTVRKVFPFDIVVQIDSNGDKKTIFEHYTKQIVDTDIQTEKLGCKFQETHMRLGSTIHVSQFYEAELIFGINLFVERFAALIALELKEKIKGHNQITVYGYSAYSELLVYKVCNFLKQECADVDYAILEREIEKKGSTHIDKIRYSRYTAIEKEEEQEQKRRYDYFAKRSIICIVPIGSTLKTNEKLINKFCEENGENCRDNILENYEIILVGNENNSYWESVSENRICGKRSSRVGIETRYFLRMDMEYQESLRCEMCFPKNVIDEIPLIEVNAASTIPNQAFGIVTENRPQTDAASKIKKLEAEMRALKESFLYSHIKNGDVHFLFYVQANRLMVLERERIVDWLQKIAPQVAKDKESYHVIFCPSHARNVGFAECINEVVFGTDAIIIRDDVDREYRSNFFAKYSNLYQFVKKIRQEDTQKKIRFFYADDAIITGKSFLRAKSLLKSIVKELFEETREEFCIFDSVFVMVDRNSLDNRKMYVGSDVENHYFAFRTLHVSSLRNHGNACVLCKLESDAEILKEASVSSDVYKYWESQQIKFTPSDIEEFVSTDDYKDSEKRKRAYRRLICANDAGVLLNEGCHGNDKVKALSCILDMLQAGCNRSWSGDEFKNKKEMQREYFLSYCKIVSRPFVVFNKAVKEAMFDLLLLLAESVLTDSSLLKAAGSTVEKTYLQKEEIVTRLEKCDVLLKEAFDTYDTRMELLLVILKQLAELKSNYIIRLQNINKISCYVKKYSEERQSEFYDRYIVQVKKLLGVSSDTSKSAWFDYLLFQSQEYGETEIERLFLPQQVYEQLYIENNRVILDATLKLHQMIKFSDAERAAVHAEIERYKQKKISKDRDSIFADVKPITSFKNQKSKVFDELIKKVREALDTYLLKDYCEVLKNRTADNHMFEEKEIILPVLAQILLYDFIERNFGASVAPDKKETIAQGCCQIAVYLNTILQARETFILVEAESEVHAWEDDIIERYNRIVRNSAVGADLIELKQKKEYLLMGSSLKEHSNRILDDREMILKLQSINRDLSFDKKGYHFSKERDKEVFIWKLGTQESRIYVYSQLERGRREVEYLDDIRNAMQFSYQLNSKVFNVNNMVFFVELIAGARDLNYNMGAKVVSHTSSVTRKQMYERMGKDVEDSLRRADIMMLLADLMISEHYRKSLRREYYANRVGITVKSWGDADSIFKNESINEFFIFAGELNESTKISVYNEGVQFSDIKEERIGDDEQLICFNISAGARENFLMLYLIITNSAVDGRGEIVDNEIKVFLSKTQDGRIRISNKLADSYKGKLVDDDFEVPPYNEEGISLWTASRYCKSFAATWLNRKIGELEQNGGVGTKEKLDEVREWLQTLPDLTKLEVEIKYKDEERYFTVMLPILAQPYGKFLNNGKGKL